MIADYAYEIEPEDQYVRLRDIGHLARAYLKLEGLNPAGSVKLKAARAMVAAAEGATGDLAGRRLVESTSGNLGIALASICAAKGYPLTCVTDPNANAAAVSVMRAFGADVVVIDERDANGGFLASRIRYIEGLLVGSADVIWLNQYRNPANPAAHELGTARAITTAFPNVDRVFLGVGTGGTLTGCLNWFRQHSPRTRVVAVDAVGSVTFGGPPGPRHIPGLGASRPSQLVDPAGPDEVVHVEEAAAVDECRRLARSHGLLVGGSTGTVLAALRDAAPGIDPFETVVALAPDMGGPYLDTVYSDSWVRDRGLHQSSTACHEPADRMENDHALVL